MNKDIKVGIIVIFNSSKQIVSEKAFVSLFNQTEKIGFCLVNNNSTEGFSEKLRNIVDRCENVSVINAKKNKSNSLVIRAGARYMSNVHSLKFLGYVMDLNQDAMIEAFKLFSMHSENIQKEQKAKRNHNVIRRSFFYHMFSISDYFLQLEADR